jgi:hypothetical protein
MPASPALALVGVLVCALTGVDPVAPREIVPGGLTLGRRMPRGEVGRWLGMGTAFASTWLWTRRFGPQKRVSKFGAHGEKRNEPSPVKPQTESRDL